MDIGRILARSLEIAWRYKFLWLLGFVMALTGGGSSNFNYSQNAPSPSTPRTGPSLQPPDQGAVAAILIFVACLLLIFLVLFFYFRFVARGAMVATVRAAEAGATPTLGSAWREGQSYYVRLLGLGFLVGLPLIGFAIILLLVAFVPFIGTISAAIQNDQSFNTNPGPFISGLLGFFALICCAVVCIWILELVIHPIYEFAVRAIMLENTGVTEGLSRGYRRLRENLGNTLLLYLILIASRIGWSVAELIISIPVFLIFFALVLAALSAGTIAIIIVAFVIGIPVGLLFAFIEGLFEVFESNVWTEGYLSLLTPLQPVNAPVVPSEPTLPPASAVA